MKHLITYKLFESNTEKTFFYPPDNLEDQIAFSMKWYPTLYDSKYGRIKVLAHMYLSYGTGYEWEDGKLLNTIDEFNTDERMYEYRRNGWEFRKKEQEKKLDELQDHWENMSSIIDRTDGGVDRYGYLAKIQKEINDLQDEMDNFNPYGKEYPDEKPYGLSNIRLSDYSPIFHIPENVQPDYLKGAKEIVSYILSIGYENPKIDEVAKKLGLK